MTPNTLILFQDDPQPLNIAGGKAHSLSLLRQEGFCIPHWFVVTADAFKDGELVPELATELKTALVSTGLKGKPLAVRSSARDEDSAGASFAGQFESFLGVSAASLQERILDVFKSGSLDRVGAYQLSLTASENTLVPAVIVQELIPSDSAGVAFSVDPVSSNWNRAVVSSVIGLGSSLVDGEIDADTFAVDTAGTITSFQIATKTKARMLREQRGFGIKEEPLGQTQGSEPSICDGQARAVAELARRCQTLFSRPQDIEWSIHQDKLYLLQSRPITTLGRTVDPDGKLFVWDNSNIAESYSGITLPLTFSFARYVYTEVYQQFCYILKVPQSRIEKNREVFGQMLGLVKGRVYYNLISWHKVLAMLPGYSLSKGFMEQMMGVKESLPEAAERQVAAIKGDNRFVDAYRLGRSCLGLIWKHFVIDRDITRFYKELDSALARPDVPLERMRIEELVDHFHLLERRLLRRWDPPLVNDFVAMIFFGCLKGACEKWIRQPALHNRLLADMGDVVSAEPARLIRCLATVAHDDPQLVEVLRTGSKQRIQEELNDFPDLEHEMEQFLNKFGDRCMNELKLESATLVDDPIPLFRAVGELAASLSAQAKQKPEPTAATKQNVSAESLAREALRHHPLRSLIFRWLLKHTRRRIRSRENLRFERTRLFGRVRRVFIEIGKRLAAFDAIDTHSDIFYLEVYEIIGFVEGSSSSSDLKSLVSSRKREFDRFAAEPTPADRFQTHGAVHVANTFATEQKETAADLDRSSTLTGIPCFPGVVRGIARVVLDPRDAKIASGEILVARQTDPGWIMLFPIAAGLLVERGSLLSHSAIVSRELGLPAIVSVSRLTRQIKTGDEIEMNGSTGTIRLLQSSSHAKPD